ncbi:hypothetical protein KWG64_13790 [Rahnella sp. PD12R]|uniref:response regulator receiver domain n=1 Tax=Rahnella sp. PD12R TaxID=2855688 RepID=UPI001C4725EA|nr:response regulator receiver domain [Rahnella sp. PD12R]MBV6819011.1 hypothetical protein [Rahnella sp. PD12R]
MSEHGLAMSPTYSALLQEAFIKPIRSVAVIDDEYPTIQGLLRDQKYLEKNKKRLSDVIDFCRNSERNWTVDVDDGQEISEDHKIKYSSYLNSDLLILDYHLGENDGGQRSYKALNVISELAKKPHFNMVIVHTGGYQGDGTVRDVILDVISFLQKKPVVKSVGKFDAEIEELIDQASIDNVNLRGELLDTANLEDFLRLINDHDCSSKECLESAFFNPFIKMFPNEKQKINPSVLKKWFCKQKSEQYKDFFGNDELDGFSWYFSNDDDINWIKTNNIFITVIGKETVEPAKLPEHLCAALLNWCPHPHQLMLAKLRHEIDENGFKFANEILNKKHLQSYWLEDLIGNPDEGTLDYKIWSVLSKHWEELASQTKYNIMEYSNRLIKYLNSDPENKKSYFISKWILPKDIETIKQVNCFNCSKPIDGYHLNTGHILKVTHVENISYWICMTPACDLEPSQKSFNTQSNMPVTLVRLYDLKSSLADHFKGEKPSSEELECKALGLATRNNFVFVKFENSERIEVLSFISNLLSESNPNADSFLAANHGVFDEKKELSIFRPGLDAGIPVFVELKAQVVAQLRYEYALHLLQLTGRAKSRVGLDFIQFTPAVSNIENSIFPTKGSIKSTINQTLITKSDFDGGAANEPLSDAK